MSSINSDTVPPVSFGLGGWPGMDGQVYECIRCGERVEGKDLEMRGGDIKCTHCGYRVLKKVRNPVVRRVRAV